MENQRFLKKSQFFFSADRPVSVFLTAILLVLGMHLGGCSTATTFRVLDAETKAPVEGAVALATWGGSRRMAIIAGPTFGYTAKAVEAFSDKDGYFTIPGVTGEIAFNTPLLQVYKPGYVGWNSRRIYLGYYKVDRKLALTKERENFVWKNQDIYLRPWKDDGTMNHFTHASFLRPPGKFQEGLSEGGYNDSKYIQAIDYDEDLRTQENNKWYYERMQHE